MNKRLADLLTLVIVGAAVTIALACKSSDKEAAKKVANEAPVATLAAVDLVKAYTENEVAADGKYKGKVVEVSGEIENIGKDLLDTPYVSLKGPEGMIESVQVYFDEGAQGALAALKKDTPLKVKGVVDGKMMNVMLKGSMIVP
jgi:hypothetical protein